MLNDSQKLDAHTKRIKMDFPYLTINDSNLLGSGWFFDAVLINNSIVFRMPGKHKVEPAEIEQEINLLNYLGGKLPVAIPKPIYIAPDTTYFGYPLVPGILVGNTKLTSEESEKYQDQWVNIVKKLQELTALNEVGSLKLNHKDISEEIANAKRFKSLPMLDTKLSSFIEKTILAAEKINIPNDDWKIIHGDLHGFNVLVDKNTHDITGVIDWTGICFCPLEAEFSIWEWDKKGVLEQVITKYQNKTGITVDVAKAKIWRHIDEISDLVESYEANATEEIESALKNIQRWSDENMPNI